MSPTSYLTAPPRGDLWWATDCIGGGEGPQLGSRRPSFAALRPVAGRGPAGGLQQGDIRRRFALGAGPPGGRRGGLSAVRGTVPRVGAGRIGAPPKGVYIGLCEGEVHQPAGAAE